MTRYTLRMQFGPHQDPERVTGQLLDLASRVPVDEVMVFFFAEEMNDGHETLDQIRTWIERSRPYRNALHEAGIDVSLNQWHNVLHTDRGRRLKADQPWRTMVDPSGRAASAVVCPLDEGWRSYYAETLRLYALEDFRVIWVDDDIRYHNHHPLEWGGCFCDAHIEAFCRRADVSATREDVVANCTAPRTPHPWRDIWMDMWEEMHLSMVSEWREIVEQGGSTLGLMSSDPEAHGAEGRRWADWWKAVGGGSPPVHRPHFWGYGDMSGPSIMRSIALLDQNRRLQPDGVESGPEIECFTYGRWNKSFRQIGAQLALAQILGSNNLNISLYDFMGNDPADEPEREMFLNEWRPVLDTMADEFPMSLRSYGVGIPFTEDMGRKIRTSEAGQWASLVCPSRGWAHWLGAVGQSFSTASSDHVNALAGPAVWGFSDSELQQWLAHGLLVDGEAAAILVERGFGKLIGVNASRFITQDECLYSVEESIDDQFSLRRGAQISLNVGTYAARLFQGDLVNGARLASELLGPRQEAVGHGVVVYENKLGGRTAIVPWNANADVHMSIQRAVQLRKVLSFLSHGVSLGSAEGWPWVVPQFLSDGDYWRGVVWNASPDALHEVTVHVPYPMEKITSSVHVNAHGTESIAGVLGERIELSEPMHQWEFLIIR